MCGRDPRGHSFLVEVAARAPLERAGGMQHRWTRDRDRCSNLHRPRCQIGFVPTYAMVSVAVKEGDGGSVYEGPAALARGAQRKKCMVITYGGELPRALRLIERRVVCT
jgi:hypothetical protein